MDPTSAFFSKLRRLAVTLETETEQLQHAYQTRNDDDDDTERGMGAYHQLCSEVADLKGQIRGQLAQQRAREGEVSTFLKACAVMHRRIGEDIDRCREHFGKYGYQAPPSANPLPEPTDHRAEEEDGAEERDGSVRLPPTTPAQTTTPPAPGLSTPQLSDFGLSEVDLRRILNSHQFPEAPAMPEMSRCPSVLATPAMLTPKCALRMDEEDGLRTPQMVDFGITEHTMFFNDFTMALHRKDVENAQRSTKSNLPSPPPTDSLPAYVCQESPEPPVFYTPGLKITKSMVQTPQPLLENGRPGSPGCPGNLPTTPETPFILSNKKGVQQSEPQDQDQPSVELPTSHGRGALCRQTCQNNGPFGAFGDAQTPEIPKLESSFSKALFSRSAGRVIEFESSEPSPLEPRVPSVEEDGPTQDFHLQTPHTRWSHQDSHTPEMPDLSFITQDIFKLLPDRKKTPMATVAPLLRAGGKKRELLLVSDPEFQSLPRYLKQMSLSSLNEAIQKINKASDQGLLHGDIQTEDLKRIAEVGTKAPVYFLCLAELRRLEQIQGVGNGAIYRLLLHD